MLTKKRLFERKNTEQAVDDAAHRLHPALTPRPDLRRHQINDRDIQPFQTGGNPEMKIGGIGQDREVRPSAGGRGDQLSETAPDPRKMPDDLYQSDHGQIFGPDHRFHSRRAESRPRTAEETAGGPA